MYKTIYDLLKTLNIPVAYDHFESNKTIQPPFVVYRELGVDTFKADNNSIFRDYNFEIELITTKKDTTVQGQIESLLIDNNIPYDMSNEVWDDEEKIYHNFFEI